MGDVMYLSTLTFIMSFCSSFGYGATQEIKCCDPLPFVTPQRFDLMAKYIYAQTREDGVKSSWPLEVFTQHHKVWGDFTEWNQPEKRGAEKFITVFHEILDSIKLKGFDPVQALPVNGNFIFDGGHRITACLVYQKPVYVQERKCPAFNWGASYFKNKKNIVPEGLDKKYLDAMALQYVELKKNTFIAVLFPCVKWDQDYVTSVFKKYGQIVYDKTCNLSKNAPSNLLRILYQPYDARREAKRRFAHVNTNGSYTVRVILFECENLEIAVKLKHEIRAFYKIGNYPIHINDTYAETLEYAQTFFVANSLKFLTHTKLLPQERFDAYAKKFKHALTELNIPLNNVAIDGSAVLAAYGVRDCQDLDFLHHSQLELLHKNLKGTNIQSHNCEIKYYQIAADELIFNPKHYFYYHGLKYLDIDVIRTMKKYRNEVKDRNDLKLIDKCLKEPIYYKFQD